MGRKKIIKTAEQIFLQRKKLRDKYYAKIKANRKKPTSYIIYTMTDPRDNMIRYVGMTGKSLSQRLKEHVNVCPSTFKRYPQKAEWLYGLELEGIEPVIEEITTVKTSLKDAQKEEEFYTRLIVSWGINLVNIHYGISYSHKSKKGKGGVFTQEMCDKSVAKCSIPVVQLTIDEVYIKTFKSANAASRASGVLATQIGACCRKKKYSYTAGGFKWEFEKNYLTKIKNKK